MLGGAHNGFAQGVLGAGFDGGGERQQFRFPLPRERDDIGHGRFSARNRASLVKDDGCQLLGALQHLAAAYQDAVVRALADTDHQRRRRGDAQRAGARDNQNGHECEQSVRKMTGDGPPH
ncbi:hypothetical protein D9M72_221320 [compost metagenome]